MARTQEERKAETRSRLLAAAAELFADHGVDAVSVDAVAEAAGRTSGAVYAHFGSKQGLLLALLDSWKDSVLTVLLAEVAVTDSPAGQLGAVWANVSDDSGRDSSPWPLLEHELWLRAARDPEVADVVRARNAEALRYSARRIDGWTSAVGATPGSDPEELAVLVKALLTGLAMQKRLDPDAVPDDLALRGLAALVGLPTAVTPATVGAGRDSVARSIRPEHPPTTEETPHAH
jgi:AcrR family transcriptional regulator